MFNESRIMPPQFRYTLNVRGVDSYVLPNAPSGWQESLINWERSLIYYGVLRSFTVPMEFVLDGAWILRTEFYTYGLRARVSITIEERNNTDWGYDLVYEGNIDFSTFEDELTSVTVKVIEGGIYGMIKAYEDVDYTLDLNVPEAIDVQITPLKLQETNTFIFLPELVDPKADYFTGLELVTNNSQSLVPSVQDVPGTQDSSPNFATSDKWFYKAQTDGTVKFSGNLIGHLVVLFGGTSKTFRISILDQGGFTRETIVSFANQSVGNHPFNVPLDYSIDLVAGERLFIYMEIIGGTIADNGFIIEEGEMTLTYNTSSVATMCKGLRPKYVFQQLIKKMNNDINYPVQSFLLDQWEQLIITSGNAIRQLEDATMILSFKDFFQSINSVLNVGFGIESGKAVLEAKSYFFKSILQAANVGLAKDFNLVPYEPFIYSSIKVGYEDQTFTTIVNGKIETNSTQTWTTPVTNIQKELNLVSIIRADPYGIEDTRITLLDNDLQNSTSDNSCFFIKVKPQPETGETYYQPQTTDGYISLTTIAGDPVPAGDSLYNYDLTPKHNLLRHGDFIRSFLDKFDGFELKLASALRNTDIVVVDNNGVRVQENQNITIGTLAARIFLPYLITETVELPADVLGLINSFPTGYIRTRYLDNDWDGFIIAASVDAAKNSPREFKTLLTPFNNITNFIH